MIPRTSCGLAGRVEDHFSHEDTGMAPSWQAHSPLLCGGLSLQEVTGLENVLVYGWGQGLSRVT